MSDVKIHDYPDLRKRGAGVVNVNDREYRLALARKTGAEENKKLKSRVENLERQLAAILEKLKD